MNGLNFKGIRVDWCDYVEFSSIATLRRLSSTLNWQRIIADIRAILELKHMSAEITRISDGA